MSCAQRDGSLNGAVKLALAEDGVGNQALPVNRPGALRWWRRGESNPRPQALDIKIYVHIQSLFLVPRYPTDRENRTPATVTLNSPACRTP
jgi:hypothetical protein